MCKTEYIEVSQQFIKKLVGPTLEPALIFDGDLPRGWAIDDEYVRSLMPSPQEARTLRMFATVAWDVVKYYVPRYVWEGMIDTAVSLGIEVSE